MRISGHEKLVKQLEEQISASVNKNLVLKDENQRIAEAVKDVQKLKAKLEAQMAEEEQTFMRQEAQMEEQCADAVAQEERFRKQRDIILNDLKLFKNENQDVLKSIKKFQDDVSELLRV